MISTLRNVFRIPDLRNKILFTFGMLVVFRLGAHIPLPGIDTSALYSFFETARTTALGLYDIFVGGGLSSGAIFGLGIMPYISASIILQLLGAAMPYFQRLQREGEEGRRKINQYTRYLTIVIGTIQALGVCIFLETARAPSGESVVANPGMSFRLLSIITLVTGTLFIMWIGELITDRGIGNGISLIIMVGIVARGPRDFISTINMVRIGAMGPIAAIAILVIILGMIAAVVLITQGQRRIPVQYAQRVVGRKIYGGRSTHLPLNMNAAGIIPIIFAQALLTFPLTIGRFFTTAGWMQTVIAFFCPMGFTYNIIYAVLIVFFAYFYTAVVLNPVDIAENMKKYGGFVPGVRPGKNTAEYIDRIISRVTLPGALFFAAVAIIPSIIFHRLHAPFVFGGTSVLIVVGVALDTMRQMEAQLTMRHYDGFVKKGSIRGRRG